jgi:protein SCO1
MKRPWQIAALVCAALVATALSALAVHAVLLAPEPAHRPALTRAALSHRSLYQLTSRWVSEQGQSIELIAFGGQVLVVAMIFTSCPAECPTLVKDLQRLERSLPAAVRAETRFVLISIDPQRDTPQVLNDYASKMGLDPARWTLLHGDASDVRELSAVLGFAYGKSDGDSRLVHAKLVTVLNRRGEVVEQQAGVRDDPERIVRALERASQAEPRP